MSRNPTCVFDVDADLVAALEAALGPPIDSYLNGWQVWIEPVEPDERRLTLGDDTVELEYRLHPPHGFQQPAGLSHHDLWDAVVEQLAEGGAADGLRLGTEIRRLDEVWVLLEVYPAFGEDVAPEWVARVAAEALGRPPRAWGYVDHERLGASWRRAKGDFDLPGAVLADLGAPHR